LSGNRAARVCGLEVAASGSSAMVVEKEEKRA